MLTGSIDNARREKLLSKGIVDYVTKEGKYSYQYAVKAIQRLEKNQNISRDIIIRKLVELLYKRRDMDFKRGSFRVKGDILEIFPSHFEDKSWRISMFGDAIETITEVDPLTGEKIVTGLKTITKKENERNPGLRFKDYRNTL